MEFFKKEKADNNNYLDERERMIKEDLIPRGIVDEKVLAAIFEVPRHLFVPKEYKKMAYQDSPLPIEKGQTISQPYIVALMIQALEPAEGDSILEVGTGSGYAAAVLSRIVSRVYTIEIHQKLADQAKKAYDKLGYENIKVKIANGMKGWPEKKPFNGIIVSAAPEEIPKTLIKQLKIGGNMLVPVGEEHNIQKLKLIKKVSQEDIEIKNMGGVRFVPIRSEI